MKRRTFRRSSVASKFWNRTWYVDTQINIKAKYGLGVTAAERNAMIQGAQDQEVTACPSPPERARS